ncbi:Rho termination factor N-terminal domain-containing protein [Chroococcidiopsis sp. FACHB-1243]|uniref:Rho termination factor N-terminal domain-containing protein n=1 Tax=Chroococcidiopsis sp. [FACHB-1243] TaxID=2692781 RepID=UPI001782FD33|nr:Rho termination factor N-terminal domain-containing protein [Chroococcidiopsis sp. [FACHB-1243]]MBD2305835.1 Rho termination factor N-terminal domain-containing protein [Chroococcidiopsis sp. [FACHB-1243]]
MPQGRGLQLNQVRPLQGWDVIEPDTSWIGWGCTLPVNTPYWSRVDELLKKNIRQLKKLARERHVRGYGDMTKSQLIAALSV